MTTQHTQHNTGQGLFALGGTDALSTFIFSLMILPNLIKIITTPTAGYDDMGWDVDGARDDYYYSSREGGEGGVASSFVQSSDCHRDRCYSFESWYISNQQRIILSLNSLDTPLPIDTPYQCQPPHNLSTLPTTLLTHPSINPPLYHPTTLSLQHSINLPLYQPTHPTMSPHHYQVA